MAFPEDPLPISSELQIGSSYLTSGAIASGIDAYSGGQCYSPSTADLHVGSDIDLRIDLTADDWTPPRGQVLAAKNYTYGIIDDEFSWELELLTDGRIRFLWSENGQFSTLREAYSSIPTGIPDGTRKTVRVFMDANNGATTPVWAVVFSLGESTAGPFIQLGDVQFGTAATQIAETDAPIEIGTTNLGTPGYGLVSNFQGKIYHFELYDAFFGNRVCNPDFTNLPRGAESFEDGESNTWYVYGSHYIAQEWIETVSDVRHEDDVVVTRGQSSEGTNNQADPSSCEFTLDNRTGDFSSRNPLSQYYGKLTRSTPYRVSLDSGEPSALRLPRYQHDYAYALDSAALSITGDLDIRVDVELPSWQGKATLLLAKSIAPTERGYFFVVDEEGFLNLTWSTNGTNGLTRVSTEPLPLPHHGRRVVRATLDVNNGASGHTVNFYVGDSLTGPWFSVGSPVVTAGTTSIFDSDAEIFIGGGSTAHEGSAHGRWFGLQVRNGIDGTLVAAPDFTVLADQTRQFMDAQGNVWRLAGNAEVTDRDDRFVGEVASWPQQWDPTGTDVYVPAQASGILRRLGQGTTPLKSTMRRGVESLGSTVIGYWPCEDSDGATSIASALPGKPPMAIQGAPDLASFSDFDCSKPILQLKTGMLVAYIPEYADLNSEFQLWFLLNVPVDGVATEGPLCSIWTRDSNAAFWQLRVTPTGGLRIMAFSPTLANLVDTTSAFAVNGKLLRVSLGFVQNASGGIDWSVHTLEVGAETGLFIDDTLASTNIGRVTRVDSNHERVLDDVAIGHIQLNREIVSLFDLWEELDAYVGERAGDRIWRLCEQEGIPIEIIGSHLDTPTMGPQGVEQVLNLIDEAVSVDMGLLSEPRDFIGLRYRTRASMHHQSELIGTPLTLDYTANHFTGLDPTDDDKNLTNEITVEREGGSSINLAVEEGPFTEQQVGKYEDSVTLNLEKDTDLPDQAGWRIHLGTVDEARYPTISVNLERAVFLADEDRSAQVRHLDVGDELTLTNFPVWMPPDDVGQRALGFTETLGTFTHRFDINCAPSSPYDVGIYDDASSRYDTQHSRLPTGIDSTQTSFVVSTREGPIWQTVGDFPFDINIGGERMRVTAVSGSSMDQTFTVERSINGIVKAHNAETSVNIFSPVYYGMGEGALAGFIEPEAPPAPEPEPDPDVTEVFRYNTGGPLYTDLEGKVWLADTHFTGGTVANQGAASYGTQHDEILKTERWGAFTYAIPFVPVGTATVKLYFSENFAGTPVTPGYRAFDVTLNGTLVADNLDIRTEAGALYTELIKTYVTTIPASGVCTIAFTQTGSPNNAAVLMGIEILAEGDTPPTTTGVAPFADIGATTSILKQGSVTGGKYKLAGMNVWGITDNVTTSFSDGQYTNRVAICNTIKSWGGNYIRMRLYANYYNGLTAANKTAMINKIVDWRNAARSAGLLFCPCWWDALDGPYSGANWASSNNWQRAFDMMTAVRNALGNDPYTFYEPFNEPNNVTDANWQTAMQSTIAHFRAAGYTGLLVIDTTGWSHNYSDTYMTNIETYDAGVNGTGRANIAFAMHDYGNEFPSDTWSDSYWTDNRGGAARDHILMETEYGAYNTGETVLPWAQAASIFFAATMQTQDNFSGAAPFLFGPWLDNNAITTSDNVTTTTWGGYAKNDFLADADATPVPPYTAIPDPPDPDPDPTPGSGTGWYSGVVRPEISGQYTQANVDYWSTNFRGTDEPVTCTLTYSIRTSGWDAIVQPGYVLGNWTNPNLRVVIAHPFTPSTVAGMGAQASAINSGAYDGYWRTWGNSINAFRARGMANPVTELGWEFNGNWMTHSATDAAAWRTAFARIVTNIRATCPDAIIAWTVNAGYSQNPPSHNAQDCWPGDSYVDLVGVDIYDHFPRAVGYAAVNTRENTNTGRAKYWEAFADLHNKQMIFPEWGLNNSTNDQANGGGDNPGYLQWMHDWFQHLRSIGLMFGDVYFNDINTANVWSDLLGTSRNPNSRAAYLARRWPPA